MQKLGTHPARPDAWRRSLSDSRATTRPQSWLVRAAVTLVVLAAVAMAVWFFFFAGSPLAPYN
jgi:hypothetical protein